MEAVLAGAEVDVEPVYQDVVHRLVLVQSPPRDLQYILHSIMKIFC